MVPNNAGGDYSIPEADLIEILDYAIASGIDIMTHKEFALLLNTRTTPLVRFEDEYIKVLKYSNTVPTYTEQTSENIFVKTLKDGDVWDDLSRLYILARHINSNGEAPIAGF